jgi:hypothetical protein
MKVGFCSRTDRTSSFLTQSYRSRSFQGIRADQQAIDPLTTSTRSAKTSTPEVWLTTYFLPSGTNFNGVETSKDGDWYTLIETPEARAWALELSTKVHGDTLSAVNESLHIADPSTTEHRASDESGLTDAEKRKRWHRKLQAVASALQKEVVAPTSVCDDEGVWHSVGYKLRLGDENMKMAPGTRSVDRWEGSGKWSMQ